MKRFWLDAILLRPWVTLLLGIIFIMAAGYGGGQLYFRGDYKIFFGEENPQLMAFEQMQRIFNKNENASIVIEQKSGNIFNKETLTMIKEMTDDAWQTPHSSRVDSIANYQHTWAEDDDLIVEDLILESEMLDDESIERVKAVALSEPNLLHRMVSEKGHVAVINVTVQLPDAGTADGAEDATKAVTDISAYLTELTDGYAEKYPGHAFYHTGIVFMNNSFATEAKKDSSTLVPLMFLAIIVILWILLRSFTGTLSTVIVIIGTIVSTMGISGWMGYFLSTATVNVPTMVMTLAVADCVHVISSMLYALRQGKSKDEALRYSMQLNLMPIFITSATTSIGFLTLNFANVPVLADLGNLTALGVMLAFVFSVTLLPALLKVLPMRTKTRVQTKADNFERFGNWVINNHKRLLPISIVVMVITISFTFNNQINDIATEYFDESTAFRQSTDFQQNNISGMSTVDFALYSGDASGLNRPAFLKTVDGFSEWLRTQPEVDHVSTISDTFKRLNKNMHGDDQTYHRLPQEQELAAQYLLLYEMSLPYGLDLNNQINIDKSATRLTVTMQNQGSKEFTEFERRAFKWFEDNAPSIKMTAASPNLMFAHIGEANMSSMLKGTLFALVLISGLLVFALRSWRMGAISLIPNLLPAGIGFGIWGIYSGQINMGLSVVLSMALGIIVDDTVHFLSKYRYARVEGKTAEEGIRYAFASVGRALWITTLVLTVGFMILAMSAFKLNSDMGLLTAIIIVAALVVDFLFLPAFLMLLDKKQSKQRKKNEVYESVA
ncbi:efflux RND transporter permease subunit [Flocculibacter collagenilyticus]|uniref:efflux RND transporter permease subunit n=1 Tax=Flocculibacter collagenilyticus TaxID=2744479 RepID=UPI0018F70A0E|nr:MMPL family transporter [Flocculibacter collagenilyticus]